MAGVTALKSVFSVLGCAMVSTLMYTLSVDGSPLRKDPAWYWGEDCQRAFKDLEVVISSKLVLKLPQFDKPVEVHIDAFDRTVYLLGSTFVIKTENIGNTFFKTQKKFSPGQARRQEFLAEYDFEWKHQP